MWATEVKRWRLLPPASAEWGLQAYGGAGQPGLVELEQRAGDVVLVPDGWAHSTFLVETCVSVTFEFVPGGHILS